MEKRVEVTEETKERLDVLELDRTPRPEKLAREAELMEGASEVRFSERAFRPRHPATLDEIRGRVDQLVPQRRALPPIPPLPAPPPRPNLILDDHRRALAPHVKGTLVAVERVYRTEAGEVVEATIETASGRRMQAFLIESGVAKPVDDVERRVDALPEPTRRKSLPSGASDAGDARGPPEKKGLLGRFRRAK